MKLFAIYLNLYTLCYFKLIFRKMGRRKLTEAEKKPRSQVYKDYKAKQRAIKGEVAFLEDEAERMRDSRRLHTDFDPPKVKLAKRAIRTNHKRRNMQTAKTKQDRAAETGKSHDDELPPRTDAAPETLPHTDTPVMVQPTMRPRRISTLPIYKFDPFFTLISLLRTEQCNTSTGLIEMPAKIILYKHQSSY